MKLYYAPGGCSMADHIALIEAGLPYELIQVGRDKKTADGRDFTAINPKGYTPALELEDGTILTENLTLLAYIADRSGKLLPKEGVTRWRALEAVNHMSTEIHNNFKPLFKGAPEEEKDKARQGLDKHFAIIAEQLGDKPFLVGDQFTIADPFLTVMLTWAEMWGLKLPERLGRYLERMKKHPSVARALVEEGLVPA